MQSTISQDTLYGELELLRKENFDLRLQLFYLNEKNSKADIVKDVSFVQCQLEDERDKYELSRQKLLHLTNSKLFPFQKDMNTFTLHTEAAIDIHIQRMQTLNTIITKLMIPQVQTLKDKLRKAEEINEQRERDRLLVRCFNRQGYIAFYEK
ncbi:MAG: hypothetical protein EZS28_050343, partial [Streblomastix strix]